MSSSTKEIDRGAERRSAPRADHDARALPGARRRRVNRGADGEHQSIRHSAPGKRLGKPRAALEMIVILPETAEGPRGRALCDGHIVRLASPHASGPTAFSARISSHRLVGRVAPQSGGMPEWPAAVPDASHP
jgi:hypothetical protein